MNETSQLDKVFHFIIKRMIKTGRSPFYTEIAKDLAVSVEDGRKILHDLVKIPGGGVTLLPHTDYIASFPPFSNLPTQYFVSVAGQQKWYAQ